MRVEYWHWDCCGVRPLEQVHSARWTGGGTAGAVCVRVRDARQQLTHTSGQPSVSTPHTFPEA